MVTFVELGTGPYLLKTKFQVFGLALMSGLSRRVPSPHCRGFKGWSDYSRVQPKLSGLSEHPDRGKVCGHLFAEPALLNSSIFVLCPTINQKISNLLGWD